MLPQDFFYYIIIVGLCLYVFGLIAGSDLVDIDGDFDGDFEFFGMFSIMSLSFFLIFGGAACFIVLKHNMIENIYWVSAIFVASGSVAVFCYRTALKNMKRLNQVNTMEDPTGKIGTVMTRVSTFDDNGEVWVVVNGKKTLFRARLDVKSRNAVQSNWLNYGTEIEVVENRNNVLLVKQN